MLEQLREQLPESLLERDGENAEGNLKRMGDASRVSTLLPKEQRVETRNQLMEYIQEAAKEQAEKELEEQFSRELSRELSETEFDGDHRKVKKALVRETRFSRGEMLVCNLYEDQVRAVMRRMKPRLLPVLSCQSPHMERNLFFGSKMNYQELYDPEKRIFCNLEVRKKVNTAVALLVDMSGSMLDKRMEQAKLCALCLYEFCKSAGIPILVYGHHTDRKYRRVQDETVYLHSLAEFDADYNDKYRIAGMREGGCNRDGAAIIFVGEKLAKRPEKLKLLFLVSDGFPNATFYCGEKAEADLRQIKEKLEVFRDFTLDVAKEQSSQLIAQYQEASQKELEEYRKNRQAEAEHRIQLEEQKIRRKLNSKVSGELLRQKHMLDECKRQWKDKLKKQVQLLLKEYQKTQEYQDFLKLKIQMAVEVAAGEPVIIYINPSDADKRAQLEQETGAKLTVSSIEFGGGIRAVIRSRNMLIDESFASRLEQEGIYL